jgi:uncharacterized protein YndB with AHSA1/START domain
MPTTIITRTINAPVGAVFDTIAHIQNFQKAIPHITNVEILSDVESGVGTRFRETRVMGKREATAEMEVTEYVENERVRIVSDSHGTVWDSLFSLTPAGDGTRMDFLMEARPYKFFPKLMIPLTKGMVAKAIEKDMDAVKAYCEDGQ